VTPGELIQVLIASGCRLIPDGAALRVQDPQHALTDALRQAIRQHKPALLALLTASAPAAVSRPEPLTPSYPCVVCGKTERWNDHGIWRCVACWPDFHALMHR
jgi:hypothetical protein